MRKERRSGEVSLHAAAVPYAENEGMTKSQTVVSGELDLLRQIRIRAAKSRGSVRVGIGDDCAILRTRPGEEIAVTTDLNIDGRHFHLEWHSPEVIGHRTLARGLSDLAAMGARPLGAFVSLGLPAELTVRRAKASWMERFYEGLLELAHTHKVTLAGGDLAQAPLALADIVVVGAVPRGRALLRSGARPGDFLYITGTLGGAAAGLEKLSKLASGGRISSARLARHDAELAPHLRPQPRVAQGMWLQRRGVATAAIDISDGLSTDLAHLCEESGLAAFVEADALPVATGATLQQALHGGEDYELLFTARPGVKLPRNIAGVRVTLIGHMVRRRARQATMRLRSGAGSEPLTPRGWEHFR